MTGKFIVIDGSDGTGKKTQTDRLIERLKSFNYPCAKMDFPQYGKKSAGAVEEYLNGKYGTLDSVGPYRASIFFAVDRYDASFEIRRLLESGTTVISNRYVTANMGHQGAKISNDAERQKYFDWLDELEFGLFGIPRPNLNIILHIPAETAQKLVDQKGHRDYVGGSNRDIHEADLEYLKRVEKTYQQMARQNQAKGTPTVLIDCAPNGQLQSIETIGELIWKTVEPVVQK